MREEDFRRRERERETDRRDKGWPEKVREGKTRIKKEENHIPEKETKVVFVWNSRKSTLVDWSRRDNLYRQGTGKSAENGTNNYNNNDAN